MKTEGGEVIKKNKSSIVRVIISNFDDKQVKEIKVLYNKQGGVDVIRLNGTEEDIDGKMKFDFSDAFNRREDEEATSLDLNEEQTFTVDISDDGANLCVTKRSKYTNDIIRKYCLSGEYETTRSGDKKVVVSVKDEKDYADQSNIKAKRALEQSTNRILLSPDAINNYRQIACSDLDNVDEKIVIDSKEIYKINKFLSYRSNVIIYYQIINNFLMNGYKPYTVKSYNANNDSGYKPKIKEVWQYDTKGVSDEEKIRFIDSLAKHICESCSGFIKSYNEQVKNNKVSNNVNKDIGKTINIEEDVIRKDLKKILVLLSRFRHTFIHYNYTFYKALFSGRDFDTSNRYGEDIGSVSELMDLNIFKELGKIKLAKGQAKTNYLNNDSEIYILGQDIEAIKLLDVFNDLCESKNGFNKFINGLISESGEENEELKGLITEHFKDGMSSTTETIERLKSEGDFNKNKGKKRVAGLLEKKLREQQKLMDWFGGPYVYDIHSSRKYKDMYIQKKNLVDRYSKLIGSGVNDNKKAITDLNEELSFINMEMKKMTSLNSRYRLQYKMQVAFGFIKEEFNLNIKDFKDKFTIEKELDYKKSISKYINSRLTREKPKLKRFIKDYEFRDINDLFGSHIVNNLVKLYILMYLLLPKEVRGDFLGFVKKNYYEMKHVDFIDKEDEEDKDTFFHNLRLFERNAKNLEIISYNLVDGFFTRDEKDEFIKNLKKAISKKNNELCKAIDVGDYNKALILPMMKYYQIIFKLLNDIEIASIFSHGEKIKDENDNKINILKIGIDGIKKDGIVNFTNLMEAVIGVGNKHGIYQIRNDIAHINMNPLYLCELNRYLINNNNVNGCEDCTNGKNNFNNCKKNNKSISQRIDRIIDICEKENLLGRKSNLSENNYLYRNILNDFYMKKEKLVYSLRLGKQEDSLNIDKDSKNKTNMMVLEKYKLYDSKDDIDVEKIINKLSSLDVSINKLDSKDKKQSNEIINLQKEKAILNGVLKKNINYLLREIGLDMIQEGEFRYINIDTFNKEDNVSESIVLGYRCSIKEGKRMYSLEKYDASELESKGIVIEVDDDSKDEEDTKDKKKADYEKNTGTIKIICERDRSANKNNVNINLEKHYIQTVKFIIR